jgi:RNA polymerase sigma-54 factor
MRPFEQQEVVKRHELDKGTVSRHFSTKAVLTPHGLFRLSDLSRERSLEQEDKTVDNITKIVELTVKEGDMKGEYYSDQKIANIITEEGIKISREYVIKIRKKLKLPDSRERKRNGVG